MTHDENGEERLPLVDAHHHLWKLDGIVRHPGLQHPEQLPPGDHSAMCRDFLPPDYRRDAANETVQATVHIEAEADRRDQLVETQWVHELATEFGMPNAVVAHAWLDTPDAEELIATQSRWPLVRGIRSKPMTAATPDASVRGEPRTIQDERWLAGIGLLVKHGLSFDLRIPWWHLAEAAEIARRYPELPIALNHAGCPWDRSPEGLAKWRRGMEALARYSNVHCKISFLLVPDSPWTEESNRGVVRDTIAIFGSERCMFASNFPVDGIKASFERIFATYRAAVSHLPKAERARLFAGNAAAFYRV
jgi:predicted TIM-barrel fold metal-dependent hydrolase